MFVVVVLIGMKLVTQVSRCPEQSLIQQLSSDTADDLWVASIGKINSLLRVDFLTDTAG